jgi:hypothetical protein
MKEETRFFILVSGNMPREKNYKTLAGARRAARNRSIDGFVYERKNNTTNIIYGKGRN